MKLIECFLVYFDDSPPLMRVYILPLISVFRIFKKIKKSEIDSYWTFHDKCFLIRYCMKFHFAEKMKQSNNIIEVLRPKANKGCKK